MMRHEGWKINHKRVERIWRREGLKVPQKQHKRGRLWLNDGSCVRLRPEYRNHVWSYDFMSDRTTDGRPLRMLTIIDEHTRKCLAIDTERRLTSDDVTYRLTELFKEEGVPEYLRSDNGSEFTLSKKVFTFRGYVDYFILFFINLGSRHVFVPGFSTNPDDAWVAQQARNFFILLADSVKSASYLIHDMDSKFTPQFKAILRSGGIIPLKIPALSPNLNAFAERWVQSIKYECLNHFIVLGEDHLRHIVREYVDYYNKERPHQSLGNLPLSSSPNSTGPPTTGKICCRERLGGLLKHYYRKAA